jgi:flagellar assembly factor FliW
MNIESPVLGAVDIAEDKLIDFPAGLPGFEHCRRFALVHDEAGSAGLFILHSVDDPGLLFSVTGPENLGVNYEFNLSEEEIATLCLDQPADALVAVIVRKDDEGGAASPASVGMVANFMAPLIINARTRIGLQKVISKLGCEITLRSLP